MTNITAEGVGVETEALLEFGEAVDVDEGTLGQQQLKNAGDAENIEDSDQLLLSDDDNESLDEEVLLNEEVQNFIDGFQTPNLIETKIDASIVGMGDLETMLAGQNLASSVVAEDFFDVRDSLAVFAIGNVTPERRSNSASTTYGPVLSIAMRTARARSLTTLGIGFDINTVMSFPAVGDTTHGLANRASRVVTPSPGKTLRATPVWEGPTHPIALAVGRLVGTLGRICAGRRSATLLAHKVARTLDATEGTSMWWVLAFLLILLVSDL